MLAEAGWAEADRKKALSKYLDKAFGVAVPLPSSYASLRLTALNAFYFIVLYTCLYSAVAIIFTFLDYHLPDGLGHKAGMFYNSYQPLEVTIRSYLASLLVSLPLLVLTKKLAFNAMMHAKQFIPSIRLRLLYLTLFIGALILFCNLITFVYYFLSGELSMRFIIKVCILSAMCAGLYGYFKPEIQQNERAQA